MASISPLFFCVIFLISYSHATVYEDNFKPEEKKRDFCLVDIMGVAGQTINNKHADNVPYLKFVDDITVRYKQVLEERTGATTYITADDYCQRTYSNGSYLCRDNDNYKTDYESICGALYCFDAIYIKSCVFSIPPQDSTLCGNGKWCETQSCQDNSNALSTSNTCPLGDSTKPNIALNMNCKDLIAKRPSMCNDDKIGKIWCCESCGALNKIDPATFIGPAKSANTDCQDIYGRQSYFCQGTQYYKNQDFSSVCARMFCYNPTAGTCEPITPVDGVPCGNGKWCVAGQCAASSSAPVDPMAGCFYGNQYETFCKTNVVYPNIARYCSQYEQGCCADCAEYKNLSLPSGCQYGDKTPDVCQQKVTDGSIRAYCKTNEPDCCESCANLKDSTNPACPYGDVDVDKCKQYMNDSVGPGNCYSQSRQQECCDTCTEYYNASIVGCEYGDHWKDYCEKNVVPPNVADVCGRYAHQCCGTCKEYENTGHAGCRYGDRDPVSCKALMDSDLGTANCYNIAHQMQCCGTCEKIKDLSTPGCVYGDTKPKICKELFNDSRAEGNCYDLSAQINCCRSCTEAKNVSRGTGCEYGDRDQAFCTTNIYNKASAFLCFSYEDRCCETCNRYKVSDHPECKYGDKNPTNCKFQIPNVPAALTRCPALGLECCETCSRLGHPGPGGKIYSDSDPLVG